MVARLCMCVGCMCGVCVWCGVCECTSTLVESNETLYFDVSPAIQKIAVKGMNDLEKYCKKADWSGVSFHRNGLSHGHYGMEQLPMRG